MPKPISITHSNKRPNSPPLPRVYAKIELVKPRRMSEQIPTIKEETLSQETETPSKEVEPSKKDGTKRLVQTCYIHKFSTKSDSFLTIISSERNHPVKTSCSVPKASIIIQPSELLPSKSNNNSSSTDTNIMTEICFEQVQKSTSRSNSSSTNDTINSVVRISGSSKKSSNCTKLSVAEPIFKFSSGSMTPCCRICHSGVSREQLISPCHCKGSLGHVHRSCLEQWLNEAGRSTCELCYQQYNAIQTRRYRCYESLRVWVRHPRNRMHIQADFLICALLTVVTIGLVMVCLLGMQYFVLEGLKLGITHAWTQGAVAIFLGIIVFGYMVTLYLLIRDQVVPWYRWWRTAVTVRLLIQPNLPRVEETQV